MDSANSTQKRPPEQNERFDDLTGIYNRYGVFSAVEQLLKDYPDQQFCLIYWNIRKFRITNDLFGWNAGDKILVRWAKNIDELLHDKLAVYGRLELDNFVCCVPESFIENNEWTKLGEIRRGKI